VQDTVEVAALEGVCVGLDDTVRIEVFVMLQVVLGEDVRTGDEFADEAAPVDGDESRLGDDPCEPDGVCVSDGVSAWDSVGVPLGLGEATALRVTVGLGVSVEDAVATCELVKLRVVACESVPPRVTAWLGVPVPDGDLDDDGVGRWLPDPPCEFDDDCVCVDEAAALPV